MHLMAANWTALARAFVQCDDGYKLPVAYFFLCDLNAYRRASLTQHVIKRINETGARVKILTQDGTRSNIASSKVLGAGSVS